PLEAAFIELFSEKNIWTMGGLMEDVGTVDRTAALKALITWIDLGVLKEDEENTFRPLEVAEAAQPPSRIGQYLHLPFFALLIYFSPRSGRYRGSDRGGRLAKQADQMRLYWKVLDVLHRLPHELTRVNIYPVHRGDAHEYGITAARPNQDDAAVCAGIVRPEIEQLTGFMEAARREGLVVGRDGMWKLNR
ncbi:hypothetical protein B0H13DRAFT_1598935, partial [Mycena leptocephala]